MTDGTFIWTSYRDGRSYALRVRECPDVEKARAELEAVTEGPVVWQPAR